MDVVSIKFSQVKRIGDPVKAAELHGPKPTVVFFNHLKVEKVYEKQASQKQI
jgi:hypothetical protein